MLKRFLALLLVLLLLLPGAVACKDDEEPPESEPPAEEDNDPVPVTVMKSGTVGDSSVTWKFYSDGLLVLGGSGDMPEFQSVEEGNNDQPWYELWDVIYEVRVEEGVTGLSQYSFRHCRKLEKVTLPTGIAEIPFSCFEYCASLTTVVCADGLSVIGENAFMHCPRLASLTVTDSLTRVEFGAFPSGTATRNRSTSEVSASFSVSGKCRNSSSAAGRPVE